MKQEEEEILTPAKRVAKQREADLNTQNKIAIWVVAITVLVNFLVTLSLIITNREISVGQTVGIQFLNTTCGIVIGYYFSRAVPPAKEEDEA